MSDTEDGSKHKRRIVVAVFRDREAAQRMAEDLIEKDFPMDSLSVLGRAGGASGDDLLGVYYDGLGDKVKSWGAHGAFWGALWGLLSGAVGLFVIPGLGAIAAAGPIVEAIAGALGGAALAGGAMAGAAAVTELGVAMHRMGVPEDKLRHLHEAIAQGHYLVLLRCSAEEAETLRRRLAWFGGEEAEAYDYIPS